jgi:hypothetical protein
MLERKPSQKTDQGRINNYGHIPSYQAHWLNLTSGYDRNAEAFEKTL